MKAESATATAQHGQALLGQTVVVIGGSAGIGLETARRSREEGADVILTARDPERLRGVGLELGAAGTVAFDATDFGRLAKFFDDLPEQIDHVLVTGPGPYYAPLAEFDVAKARRDVEAHLLMPIEVARHAVGKVRPGGTLLFMGGTGGRRTAPGLSFISALTAAGPALTRNLALELAPIRVNLIAAGFVDTPLSAAILGDHLDARREQLRTTLPIRRVVGPADIAALAVHLMTNTAITGATFDIDGGQQLVQGLASGSPARCPAVTASAVVSSPTNHVEDVREIVRPGPARASTRQPAPIRVAVQLARILLPSHQHRPIATVVQLQHLLRRSCLVLAEESHQPGIRGERGHLRLEPQVLVADVHQEDAAGLEQSLVERERLPRHEVNRNRIRAERIEHQHGV